ncbi:chromosome segregation ATPase [Acidovorax soli]|uniref:Chromosome segregation ATPase n=1 Tax=Acidovorax soli TaxID=592050 RepID=A0A7X0PBF5_9BURK|nr:DNA-binding protein [Acidovorax soli]MBB6558684.1 chromosome segregation ATPase [Acidovorax soli]
MARGGIYKSEVLRARDRLVSLGKYPSIDAVRIELGNTGSKATIHRYLKEIEEDEANAAAPKISISEEIAELVNRLSGRLEFETNARVVALMEEFNGKEVQFKASLDASRSEAAATRQQLEQAGAELTKERDAAEGAGRQLATKEKELAQLTEQVAQLHARVESAQTHSQSLEEKHTHARQALEHFREASKEQRERELRQHEQQLQYLQTELSKANAAALASQQQMRNDHQQNQALSRELGLARSQLQQLGTQLEVTQQAAQGFADMPQQLEELTAKVLSQEEENTRLRADLLQATQRNLELERQLSATVAADAARQQLTTELMNRLDALRSPAGK